ncbi:MAG: DUF6152 family protein [Pseudomonadota bacterium]
MHRRTVLGALAATLAAPARAHHSVILYDMEAMITLEGFVSKELDGFPHWEVEMRVEGQDWQVDLQDGFAMREAGMDPDGAVFTLGRKLTVEGHPARDRDYRRVLPKRLTIDGRTYEFALRG